MSNLVLASRSPRRQELLRRMGFSDFQTIVPDVDETVDGGLSPQDTVMQIARRKSEAAARLCAPDDVIVTADTMVFLDNIRLGKPRDTTDALRMLTALSGRAHTVCTGVTVRRGDTVEAFVSTTTVHFRACDPAELRAYVATGEPMDKAGAYGIQELGALFVERIEGDFYNVMGLPVEPLGLVLRQFGLSPFSL